MGELMNSIKKTIGDLKKDNLVLYTFPYYLMTFINLSSCFCTFYLDNPWLMIWFLFGAIPFLDLFFNQDSQNPTKEEIKLMKNQFRYKIPLIIAIFFEWVVFIYSIYHIVYSEKGKFYKTGLVILNSLLQASSINNSHELNHKLAKWERFLGTFNLSKNLYMHFLIEHNEGHHKNVCTPEDPASSRLNESLYHFIPRSIIGGFLSAWKIETRKCKEKFGTSLTGKNKMIYFTISILLLPTTIFYFFGMEVMLVHFIIAFLSVCYLETINYIEHYGLFRKKLEGGEYEPVDIQHSWNAPQRISNYLLFKLQRHSDHHANSLKPYQTLCSYRESPTLPTGYPGCLLLAFFPRLWFSVMNPLVESYNKGSKEILEINEINEKAHNKMKKIVLFLNFIFGLLIYVQIKLNV
jgi:alkane 1-monooxygenase